MKNLVHSHLRFHHLGFFAKLRTVVIGGCEMKEKALHFHSNFPTPPHHVTPLMDSSFFLSIYWLLKTGGSDWSSPWTPIFLYRRRADSSRRIRCPSWSPRRAWSGRPLSGPPSAHRCRPAQGGIFSYSTGKCIIYTDGHPNLSVRILPWLYRWFENTTWIQNSIASTRISNSR